MTHDMRDAEPNAAGSDYAAGLDALGIGDVEAWGPAEEELDRLTGLVLAWAFAPSMKASRDLMAWACAARVGYVSPSWRNVEGEQ